MRKFYRLIGLCLAISVAACVSGPQNNISAGDDEDRDIGLGGTGMFADSGNGLGGTGIVGEITGFGSIFVNGIEIEYHSATPFTVDGKTANLKQLEIGDVVEVLTTDDNKHTQAIMINLRHEVIGVVESVNISEASFTVHGQVVKRGSKKSLPVVGDRVAVSGFRIDKHTIKSTRVRRVEGEQTLLRTYTELPFMQLTDRWLVQAYLHNGKARFKLGDAAYTVALEEKPKDPVAAHTGLSIVRLKKLEKSRLKLDMIHEEEKMKRGRPSPETINRLDGVKKQGPAAAPGSMHMDVKPDMNRGGRF
jgi:hypothetical protein